jgi:hypothetical protein
MLKRDRMIGIFQARPCLLLRCAEPESACNCGLLFILTLFSEKENVTAREADTCRTKLE